MDTDDRGDNSSPCTSFLLKISSLRQISVESIKEQETHFVFLNILSIFGVGVAGGGGRGWGGGAEIKFMNSITQHEI